MFMYCIAAYYSIGRLEASVNRCNREGKCIYRVHCTEPQDAYGRYDNGEGGFGSLSSRNELLLLSSTPTFFCEKRHSQPKHTSQNNPHERDTF